METTVADRTVASSSSIEEPRLAVRPMAAKSERNLALDAYRGLIMILLVSNGFGFQALIDNPRYHAIAYQLDHHWGQSYFMT